MGGPSRWRPRGPRAWAGTAALLVLTVAAVVGLLRNRTPLLDYALVSHRTPARLTADRAVRVEVELRNTGRATWSSEAGDRLAYHWRDSEGTMLVLDGLRSPLPHPVAPGETVRVTADLHAPAEPGDYMVQWRMIRENVHWFPRPDADTRVPLAVDRDVLRWAWLDASVPDEPMVAREVSTVAITVENRGTDPWRAENGDRLTYRWRDDEGRTVGEQSIRTPMPGTVAPGGRVTVQAQVRAPASAGTYRLDVEPVREGMAWYGPAEQTLEPPQIEVGPPLLAWDLKTHDTPTHAAAGDRVDVRVLLHNSGRVPWQADDALSARWLNPDGTVARECDRVALGRALAPGESIEVPFTLALPGEPGAYRLQWEPVREGVRWFGPATGPLSAPFELEVGPARLSWAPVSIDPLPVVWVNEPTSVRVVLRNTGPEPWSPDADDHFSYRWLAPDGTVRDFDGRRTRLPHVVEPGETVSLKARIWGPIEAGPHRLKWAMVRENVAWFPDPESDGGPDIVVDVQVRWLTPFLQVCAALGLLGWALWLRRRPDTPGRNRWLAYGPTLWAWAAISVVAVSFSELSGLRLWSGALGYSLSGAALFAPAVLVAGPRWRMAAAAVLVGVLSGLALADLVYMHFYGRIVPFGALTAAHHLHEVTASIAALFQAKYVWLAPVPLASILAATIWPRPTGRNVFPRTGTVAVVWLAIAVHALVRIYSATTSELGLRVFSDQRNASRLGLFNAHVFDLSRNVRDLFGREATPEQAAEITAWAKTRAAAVAPVPYEGVAKGHNLLLIQMESAQGFIVGATVDGQEITPFMNRLHRRGMAFSNFVDQTAQGKTSDAEYATLNGLHPLRQGALCFLRADNRFVTLAHVLGAQGYATFSGHPYKRGFWNRAVLHPRYGFEASIFKRELGPGPVVGWGLADGPFFERSLARIRTLPEPFFAFLVTLSTHHPYPDFPAQLAALDLGELEGTQLGHYLHGMNYLDRSLEALFQDLDETGLADRTVVALYGDHDAQLDLTPQALAVAGIEHWSPATKHRLERVPMFVVAPGGPTGRRTSVAGHVDTARTVLHLLGVPAPDSFLGRPLIDSKDPGFAAYPDGSAFTADRMFIATGRDIPANGACFHYPRGGVRPREDCDAIAQRARDELSHARAILDYDLQPRLAPEVAATISDDRSRP